MQDANYLLKIIFHEKENICIAFIPSIFQWSFLWQFYAKGIHIMCESNIKYIMYIMKDILGV